MSCFAGMGGLVLGILAAGQGLASASVRAGADGSQTCTGTLTSPGVLAGTYTNVVVSGACVVNSGPADVRGNLTLAPGASLAAIFGQNDQTGTGNSSLTVHGNLLVDHGASLMLGCYPLAVPLWSPTGIIVLPDFPCTDDPNQNAPTLSSHGMIYGNLIANDPLGVVVHNTIVRGNVTQLGGGAGLGCAPVGIFNEYFGLPEYTDYTNTTVDGNMTVTGLDTCWLGTLRNHVQGNMTVSGNLSTPDAMEVATNTVQGNLSCQGNNPAVELGDSDGQPNQVGGNATGQCGFNVLLPNPGPGVDPTATTVMQPASVKLH